MYGATRMWYENLLNVDNMTAADFDGGYFTSPKRQNLGSATMGALGSYTGYTDDLYTIDIDNFIGGSHEIYSAITGTGAAYSWKNNLSTESGTANTSIGFVTLGTKGFTVIFTGGVGNDFELHDKFFVLAKASFSPAHLFDERRDTYMRKYIEPSMTSPYSWTFDVSDIVIGDRLVFAIHDYGLINTSYTPDVFTLRSDNGYSKDLTWNPGSPLVVYLDDIDPALLYSTWSLDFRLVAASPPTDPTQVASFWMGQMYLGRYVEFPTAAMWNWGSNHLRTTTFFGDNNNTNVVRSISAQQRLITAKWESLTSTDFAILENLYDAMFSRGDNIEHSVFFHEFADEPDRVYWMKLIDGSLNRTYERFNSHSTELKLIEVSAEYVL